RTQYESAELLEHAHTKSGRDHARQVSEAGRRHDDEKADRVRGAEEGLDVPYEGDEGTSRAADRRIEPERERVNSLRVDTEDARGSGILRGCADRLAHAAFLHEQDDGDGENDRANEAEDTGRGNGDQPVGEGQRRQISLRGLGVRTKREIE